MLLNLIVDKDLVNKVTREIVLIMILGSDTLLIN